MDVHAASKMVPHPAYVHVASAKFVSQSSRPARILQRLLLTILRVEVFRPMPFLRLFASMQRIREKLASRFLFLKEVFQATFFARSEERRVGKECRSRW